MKADTRVFGEIEIEDEKIIRMRTSQLEKLLVDFDRQKREMDEIVSRAEIKTNLLVKGILHVE